jgi:hypothetical protein
MTNGTKNRNDVQRLLYCRCGRGKVLALGLCSTCYTLKRKDEEYFGGLREEVLKRDGYCCRTCGASGRAKRSITVHHRVPGVSKLHLMISLCPACHAIVTRTRFMHRDASPLLLELWREQHPDAPEQIAIGFGDSPRFAQVKSGHGNGAIMQRVENGNAVSHPSHSRLEDAEKRVSHIPTTTTARLCKERQAAAMALPKQEGE